MSESAWVDIGDALVTLFQTQLGPTSAHATLKTRYTDVFTGMMLDDFDAWAVNDQLPALIIEGKVERYLPREHGTLFTSPHSIAKEYPFWITVVTVASRSDAERNAKILMKRIETVVLTAKTLAVTDASGEQTQSMMLNGAAGVYLYPQASGLQWFCVGAVPILVRNQTAN